MGIVIVHPRKKRWRRVCKPFQGNRVGFSTRTLHVTDACFIRFCHIEIVIVCIEALVQSPFGIKNEGTYKCCCLITMLLQDFRECQRLRRHKISTIIANAMIDRKSPGKNRSVRRQGKWDLGYRALEKVTFGPKMIQVWRFDIFVTVSADMIRAQSVDRYKQKVVTGVFQIGNVQILAIKIPAEKRSQSN